MSPHFIAPKMAIVAIEIHAFAILPPVKRTAGWIQARQETDVRVSGPLISTNQFECGQWTRRFVAMDSGGDVDAPGGRGGKSVEDRDNSPSADGKRLVNPATLRGKGQGVRQDRSDINRFAAVPAMILLQFLHDGNVAENCCVGNLRTDDPSLQFQPISP